MTRKDDKIAKRQELIRELNQLGLEIAKATLIGGPTDKLLGQAAVLKEEIGDLNQLIDFLTPKEDRPRVPYYDCIPRRLYKIGSRNLTYGVYDGEQGFIGIRVKFSAVYLFAEYHWDQGPPHGTVHTVIDTGIDLPEEIELKVYVFSTENTHSTYKPLLDWLTAQGGHPTELGPRGVRDVIKRESDGG